MNLRHCGKLVTVACILSAYVEFRKQKDSEAGNDPAPLEYNPVYTKKTIHPDKTHGNEQDAENAYTGIVEKQGLPRSFYQEHQENPPGELEGSDQDDAGSLYDSLAPQSADPTPHTTPSREAVNPLYAGLGGTSPARARKASSSSRWAEITLTSFPDSASHL